jgi:DNA-directed RNA polymerase subunit alpha
MENLQIGIHVEADEAQPRKHGRIVVEPLERGYGDTLGNALRRVLLSSIEGAAVSAVRIEGVLHEFSTVPGVKEDVIEMILNLKHVPLRSHNDEVKVLHLDVEGPRKIVAGDITPDSDIDFVDPDAFICNLEAGHTLRMDFYIEKGTGYATIDRPRPGYLPVDALLIDAIYSPVKKVNYEVQNARVGQQTDYDRLVLDIWTNGVASPEEAAGEAAKILRERFSLIYMSLSGDTDDGLEALQGLTGGAAAEEAEQKDEWEDVFLSRPIRDLELSIRSENCLLRGGIQTVGDLLQRPREELLKIRNLGKISLKEIEEKIEKHGYTMYSEKEKNKGQDI